MALGIDIGGTRSSVQREHEEARELSVEECVVAFPDLGAEEEVGADAAVLSSSGEGDCVLNSIGSWSDDSDEDTVLRAGKGCCGKAWTAGQVAEIDAVMMISAWFIHFILRVEFLIPKISMETLNMLVLE